MVVGLMFGFGKYGKHFRAHWNGNARHFLSHDIQTRSWIISSPKVFYTAFVGPYDVKYWPSFATEVRAGVLYTCRIRINIICIDYHR